MLCGVWLVCGRGHLHGVGERFTRLETASAGGSIGVTIAVGVKVAAQPVASAFAVLSRRAAPCGGISRSASILICFQIAPACVAGLIGFGHRAVLGSDLGAEIIARFTLRPAALHMTAADVAFFNPARVASALPASITFETGLARSAAAACSCRFIGLRAAICCLFGWFGAILHGILCYRYISAKRQNCPERGNV